MKKEYQKPDMKVVKLLHHSIICQSIRGASGNSGVGYGGGGGGAARAPQHRGWGDEW
ncbi:MAG: hypothetical protein IJR87_09865 [Bacteroidaceae bacterium]|nr:hypothetical protein [Bacteroidaceae bacterium]